MEDDYNGPERRNHVDWHLNKSVSVSVLLLLFANLGVSVWWLSGLNNDVETLKLRPNLLERVIRLEARGDEQGRIIKKMDDTLDRLNITLNTVAKEQSRRSPIIDSVRVHLNRTK